METWKEYDQNEVTHSGAHYLMSIQDLRRRRGYARVSDVARDLRITRGSASLALKALKEKGLVDQDENRFLLLMEDGERIAQGVRARRAIFETFLTDVLRIEAEQAEIDTCKIEHLISMKAGKRLLTFMQFLLSDDPQARAMLDHFWDFESRCGDEQSCPVCDGECLAAD